MTSPWSLASNMTPLFHREFISIIKSVWSVDRPLVDRLVDGLLCWNRRIFLGDSMSFHGFLCDSMPTPLVGSRRFLLYNHLSVVSRRFYSSMMYIMSQSPPSYLRIDTLSPSASTYWRTTDQTHRQTDLFQVDKADRRDVYLDFSYIFPRWPVNNNLNYRHFKRHIGVEKSRYHGGVWGHGEWRVRRALRAPDATITNGGQEQEATSQKGQMIRQIEVELERNRSGNTEVLKATSENAKRLKMRQETRVL